MSSVKEFIANAIKDNKVVVFSKSSCPYCVKTKSTLSSLDIPFHAIELDKRADGADIQDELLALTKQRTVPNVFVNGKHIGGNDSTQAAIKDGSFQQAYESA
eukprot:gene23183-26247_t